jgi:hypothetical protein
LQNQPYAHFFGADVATGGQFDNSGNQCLGGSGGDGRLEAFVRGSGALTRGSGSQLATLLFNNSSLSQFDSATLRTGVSTASAGLTFANRGGIGGLKQVGQCVPNYLATNPHDSSHSALSGSTALDDLSGAYDASSDLTITASTVRSNTAIYSNDDIYITGDINYLNSNGGWSYDTSDHSSNVPSLYLITSGNIYIGPNVSSIDAVLVAQGGTIYTCAGGFTKLAPNELFNECATQPLTINGALIARNIELYRTRSSLRDSAQGEYPDHLNPTTSQCDTGDNGQPTPSNPLRSGGALIQYDCAAEIILFSPEIYLSRPALSGSSNGPIKYDYITSLSPVL